MPVSLKVSLGDLLRPITAGDLHGWRGLPSDLKLPQLTADFPPDSDWHGAAQLGRSHREASYLWVNLPGPDSKLRVWFDGERVILLDLECSGIRAQPDQLTSLFAEKPELLDTWRGVLPMQKSEMVFAKHGLAAFVNHDTKSIWHLALFAPITLTTYLDDLRIDMQTRRRQMPKRQ